MSGAIWIYFPVNGTTFSICEIFPEKIISWYAPYAHTPTPPGAPVRGKPTLRLIKCQEGNCTITTRTH